MEGCAKFCAHAKKTRELLERSITNCQLSDADLHFYKRATFLLISFHGSINFLLLCHLYLNLANCGMTQMMIINVSQGQGVIGPSPLVSQKSGPLRRAENLVFYPKSLLTNSLNFHGPF